jgi:ferrochelatase
MGAPNNLDEVELFLKNMFNDKYIITAPKLIRKLISFIIVNRRLDIAKNNYKELGGVSPLVGNTKRLVRRLNKNIGDADVFYVMRYTPPFASEVVPKLVDYDNIYLIPMYPHYSNTTTRSSIEDFLEEAKKFDIDKKVSYIESYYKDELYNKAIVERIKDSIKDINSKEYELVFSAHGLTQRSIDKGDPYQQHIIENVNAIKKMLSVESISFNSIHIAYQSRVGPMEWIRPYLEDKLQELKGRKVLIYPISFTLDNSETDLELEVEYKEVASEIGIKDYRVCRALNSSQYFIDTIKKFYNNLKIGD